MSGSPDDGARFGKLSVEELAEAIGRRTPAPGGGSAAAICGAVAASLVVMAARFARDLPAAPEIAERARVLTRTSLQLADADADAYARVLAARSIARRQGDAAAAARREADGDNAAEVPLQICEAAAETAGLAAQLVLNGRPSLVGDALTGALLAEAVVESCLALVDIDLPQRPDDPRRVRAVVLGRETHGVVDGIRRHRATTEDR